MKNEKITCNHHKWNTQNGEHFFKYVILLFKLFFDFRFHDSADSFGLYFYSYRHKLSAMVQPLKAFGMILA